METQEHPPLGRLIESAREATGLSVRQAAKAADLSDTRWRHIVTGRQPVGQGQYIEVAGPPATWARMARAVRLRYEDLWEVDREVATILRTWQAEEDEEARRQWLESPVRKRINDEENAAARADELRVIENLSSEDLITELRRRLLALPRETTDPPTALELATLARRDFEFDAARNEDNEKPRMGND